MRRWAEASPHAAPSPLVREGWGGEALLTRLLPPSRLARSAREATPDRIRGRLSPTRGEVSGASGQAFTKTITVAAVLLIGCMVALAADELAVDAVNASTPTLCAERDNVTIELASARIRRFGIEAVHPAYIGTLANDRGASDFSGCDFAVDSAAARKAQRVTIYETEEWQLVGHRLQEFWRAGGPPVRVGERVETGLHLIQLWHRFAERAEEVLVLYPPDGYWRARPLPPAHLAWSAYGSSFLVGPIETDGRPFVDLSEITFDPDALSFALKFARGGAASLRLAKLDRDRIALDVTLDPVLGRPFAALRSMFVMETNADVARIAWREAGGTAWREAPVDRFERASAVELWAGRAVPSRHNASAPDLRFSNFSAAPR